MKVATKLAGGYLTLILVFGGLLLFYHRALERSVEAGRELTSVNSRVLLTASGQLDLLDQLQEDASKYRITNDGGYLRAYRTRRLAFEDTLTSLARLPLSGGTREAADNLSESWESFRTRFAGFESEADEVRFLGRAPVAEWDAYLTSVDDLRRRVRELRRAAQTSVTRQIRDISTDAEQAARTGWIVVAVALLLAGALAVGIVRSITGPLARIESSAVAISRGNFDTRVDLRRSAPNTEFVSLARSFNRMAARLGDLDQAQRDFLAKISHDLKTPLASIRETKGVLLDGLAGELNPRQEHLLRLGVANTDRLSDMISKLLELSRLEAGVEQYESEAVNLVELCGETVGRLAPGPSGPELRFRPPAEAVWVDGDRGALQRVVENLVENARTHAPNGVIEVSVRLTDGGRKQGSRAEVRVQDQGPGIPVDQRERIFERFFSSDRSPATSGHVGLGLAICREIITVHDGAIWVDEGPGGGSVFTFALAARTPADETHADGPTEPHLAGQAAS